MRTNSGTVRTATGLWVAAVAAGVVETLLVVVPAVGSGPVEPGLWMNLAVHVVVYAVAAVVIANFVRGRGWSRIALTLLLGVIGLGSMVVPAINEMLDGRSFVEAFGGGGGVAATFLVVRLAHIACVIGATALMFTPPVSRHLAKRSSSGTIGGVPELNLGVPSTPNP